MLFSDPWSAQLLAVNFFFLISNYLAEFLKHFDGGKKSHYLRCFEIRLNPATYSGEKTASLLVAPFRIQRQILYYESGNKTSSIIYLKYCTYFTSCLIE